MKQEIEDTHREGGEGKRQTDRQTAQERSQSGHRDKEDETQRQLGE